MQSLNHKPILLRRTNRSNILRRRAFWAASCLEIGKAASISAMSTRAAFDSTNRTGIDAAALAFMSTVAVAAVAAATGAGGAANASTGDSTGSGAMIGRMNTRCDLVFLATSCDDA